MTDIYTKHKPIRNKIKRYEPLSIVEIAISKLHELDDLKPTKWNGYLPWAILLLIRWTYQYSEPSSELKKITMSDFNKLHNAITELGDGIELEGQNESNKFDSFLRRTMFCQLPYQLRPYELSASFGRQLILFSDMGQSYNLDIKFKSITGISIEDFVTVYFACWTACSVGEKNQLSIGYFNGKIPEEILSCFFNTLSLDLGGGKIYIREYTDPRASIDYQQNEHTPLERKPFFKHNGNFFPYSSKLLESGFINNIYDIFKKDNRDFSRDYFGDIFEDYVAKGMQYAFGESFLREKRIKQLLPKGVKVPDFMLNEEDSTIMFDAKSTELHSIPRVIQTKESLIKNLEDTVLHGLIQIYSSIHHLIESNKLNDTNKIFGVIVTYREYLLGDGKRLWEDYVGEHIQQKLNSDNITPYIDPKRLFIISIDDFDWLVSGAKERKESVSSILEEISERNERAETRCLILKQHLEKMWGQHYSPPYVKERRNSSVDGLLDNYKK